MSAPTRLSTVLSRLKRISVAVLKHPALVASLTVTGLLLVGRQLSLLEPLELTAYDRLMQLRPALPPDSRLLVVTITEEDIRRWKYPLTDEVINRMLVQLQQAQPAVIGLDIYRDIPVQPGHEELTTTFKNSDHIIPVCKRSNVDDPGTPPPPVLAPQQQGRVGFSDLATDPPNGIIRRTLLFITGNPDSQAGCTTRLSFSFQLTYHYLTQQGIEPEVIQQGQQEYLKIGNVLFKPLLPNDGGYQKADTGGYQLLLDYRTPASPGRTITLTDVLTNRFDKNLVKGRIVLIGVTASSIDDAFYTPYNSQALRLQSQTQRIQKMPGVMVHGQIVSQLLSSTLDGRSLFWFWPEWGEVLWIWTWSLAGGVLVRIIRHPGQLVLAEIVAFSLLLGTSVILFLGSGWVPIVAPSLGLITTGIGVLAYSAYQDYRNQLKTEEEIQYIKEKAQEQSKNIALLQALLKEKTYSPPTTKPDEPLSEESEDLTEQTEMPPEDDSDDSTELWPQGDGTTGSTEEQDQTEDDLLKGRYKLNRVIGAGGFGLTHLAQDMQRPGSPQCVVKQLKPARRDERFLQIAKRLFDTEAEILEKLGDHAQIPRLLAHFVEKKEFYLVQEYIDGHTLSDELPVDKRLPEAQVVEILTGVLEILIFIHKHSVIHRDIKPSNIMRRELDGKLVLIDFGAVKQIQPQEQDQQEGFTVAIGTRGYAPSELYAGHPAFSSDIYSLGMIAIQALTGISPHQLPLSQDTGDVSWRHLANVSEELGQILEKMVRYHFIDRYQKAELVMKDLEGLKGVNTAEHSPG